MYFIKYKTVNNLTHAGSGKTYLAAFDVLNFNPRRLLYIVHEGSILMKSVETFQRVFGADKTYGVYNAEYKEFELDYKKLIELDAEREKLEEELMSLYETLDSDERELSDKYAD